MDATPLVDAGTGSIPPIAWIIRKRASPRKASFKADADRN
jgi:hypothetical protein